VLKWPGREEVLRAAADWARRVASEHPEVVAIGCFGSIAQGRWGIGSDLDMVMIVKDAELPFERRSSRWDTTELPVPVDLLVYTEGEWKELKNRLKREVMWLFQRKET